MTSIEPRDNGSEELPRPVPKVFASELAKEAGTVHIWEELIQLLFGEEKGLVFVFIGDAGKEEIPKVQKV